jgi:hypothetical protein
MNSVRLFAEWFATLAVVADGGGEMLGLLEGAAYAAMETDLTGATREELARVGSVLTDGLWVMVLTALATLLAAQLLKLPLRFFYYRHHKDDGHPRCSGSARRDWWAVKDSNLGPAD